MRKGKRLLAVLLVIIMSVTTFTACSGGGAGGNAKGKKEIKINYWLSGMGEQWLKDMKAAFEEEYPEYYVNYDTSSSQSALLASFGMEDVDDTDLYFVMKSDATEFMEPLDDLLLTTAKGDTKPLKDKFNQNYLQYEKSPDGHYYTLVFGGGMISFYYNKDVFEEAGITQLPRTTDELTVLCDTISSKGVAPLCHFKDGGYYEYLLQYYMAQYSGMDYYLNNFWACTDEAGNSPSKEIFTTKDGRYYGLKAMEKYITPNYTMSGSITQSHTEVQTQFLNGSAAMMLNGSWIENEMKTTKEDSNIGVMKMPVLSAIVNTLTTVKTDAALRKLITAIDQVTDGEKKASDFASGENYIVEDMTVSADDWNRVMEARTMISCNYTQGSAFVTRYSNQKEGALKFLEFMYSDKGYKQMAETIKFPLPLQLSEGEIDTSEMSEAQKIQFEWNTPEAVFVDAGYSSRHEIFITGNASEMADIKYVDKFCAGNSADRMTADEVWELLLKTVDENYEKSWLVNMKAREN